MKILWIVNTIFPAPSKALGIIPPVVGGWMYGLSESISRKNEIKLAVATVYLGKTLKRYTIDNIDYYLLPCKDKFKYDRKLEYHWQKVCSEFQPEIVHVHGTELAHGLACMRKCSSLKFVISIQGLVSVYERFYYTGISSLDIFKNITIRDILKRDSLFQARRKFQKRGRLEKEYIKNTTDIVGRTSWDYVHAKTINPDMRYHFCNESLRDEFYEAEKWAFEKCEPYSIFISQAGYPIKGLHQLIKAVALLINEYPLIKVKIGGESIIGSKNLKGKLKLSGYGKYIKRLLKKEKLEENFLFLGSLTGEKMISQYQNSHVFICPSSIENSPNSIGEAQLIGVPVIASYVGGVPDMIVHNHSGLLYRFEEVEMLAENIRKIFNNNSLALELSYHGLNTAISRHNKTINLDSLLNIYKTIIN